VRSGIGLDQVEERRLMGNHEQLLRAFLSANDRASANFFLNLWYRNGGKTVLAELGHTGSIVDPLEVGNLLRTALGPDGLAFLDGLEGSVRCGRFLFVHAGIHPQRRLREFLAVGAMDFDGTERDHWAWIREPFLSWEAPFEDDVFVVHGHTISRNRMPDRRPNRLGIDTGAFANGPLTAVEFRDQRLRFHFAPTS
jgi:serine/threonine protein phosphatase 1